MITKEQLMKRGYIQFEVPITKPFVNDFYQRKITDNVGKKYFIDFFFYESGYEVELYQEKEKYAMNIKLYAISSMSLDEVEQEIENIWVALGKKYYERWAE